MIGIGIVPMSSLCVKPLIKLLNELLMCKRTEVDGLVERLSIPLMLSLLRPRRLKNVTLRTEFTTEPVTEPADAAIVVVIELVYNIFPSLSSVVIVVTVVVAVPNYLLVYFPRRLCYSSFCRCRRRGGGGDGGET